MRNTAKNKEETSQSKWEKRVPIEYIVNLLKIEGDRKVTCPKCKSVMDPDDKTEENYRIIEVFVTNNKLSGVLLECVYCNSRIRLIGFEVLKK